jgi:hypothetical protein
MLMDLEEGGDTSVIKEIAVQFLEDVAAQISRAEKAAQAGDLSEVAAAAHTIKGSAATFGLYRVEKFAKQLEATARGTAAGDAHALIASVQKEFAIGQKALNEYLSTQ